MTNEGTIFFSGSQNKQWNLSNLIQFYHLHSLFSGMKDKSWNLYATVKKYPFSFTIVFFEQLNITNQYTSIHLYILYIC